MEAAVLHVHPRSLEDQKNHIHIQPQEVLLISKFSSSALATTSDFIRFSKRKDYQYLLFSRQAKKAPPYLFRDSRRIFSLVQAGA